MPVARIQTDIPTGRIGRGAILSEASAISVGMPIGLLLALTYASAFNVFYPVEADIRTRIKTD